MNRRHSILLAVALALAPQESSHELDGFWQTDGYGLLVVINGGDYLSYETTPIGAVPSLSGRRLHEDATSTITFMLETDVGPWRFNLLLGENENSLLLHADGSASDILLRRLPNRPDVMDRRVPNDPESNFEVFWHGFQEHYPFFDVRRVDWEETRRNHRPRVGPDTTEDDLFEILFDMIEPLHDAHTFVATPGFERVSGGRKPDPDPLSKEDKESAMRIADARCLEGRTHSLCEGRLQYGRLNEDIGYLRLTEFREYAANGDYREGMQSLRTGLDQVFEDLSGINGLVVDIRINPGGFATYGIEVANRLATKRYLAYTKRARNDPEKPKAMTLPQLTWVEPNERPGYRGPIVLLTSRYSVSGAETFAMALMGREPSVIRVGEETQGVFSDILLRHLPNGWLFALPNEVYFAEDGANYDAVGVPPDVPLSVFLRRDLEEGEDPALERAVEILSS